MGKVYISCTDKEWSDMEDGKINIIDYKGTEYVRVVRCKDCRYQRHTNYMKVPICGKMSEDGHEIHAEDDFYCAKGKRRE